MVPGAGLGNVRDVFMPFVMYLVDFSLSGICRIGGLSGLPTRRTEPRLGRPQTAFRSWSKVDGIRPRN